MRNDDDYSRGQYESAAARLKQIGYRKINSESRNVKRQIMLCAEIALNWLDEQSLNLIIRDHVFAYALVTNHSNNLFRLDAITIAGWTHVTSMFDDMLEYDSAGYQDLKNAG